MFALKRLMPAASLLAFLALPACGGDSLSPNDVDPVVLAEGMSDASETFSQQAIFQSVIMLSPQFPSYGSPAAGLARLTLLRAGAPGSPEGRAAATQVAQLLAGLSSNPQALFPANLLGKTLDWDVQADGYVVSTLAGAPATGIRILLYFANPATGTPFLPLTLIGGLDLTDKSTPQADKLGVKLSFGQATVAEYDITVVGTTSSATITAGGYLASVTGSSRLDFTLHDVIAVSGNAVSLISTNDIASAGTAIHVVLTHLDIFEDAATITARVQRGNATLELTATGALGAQTGPLSGSIKFNNTTVASIDGTYQSPDITGAGGHSLSVEQIAALLSIFGAAIEFAFDFSTGVFAPGSTVF